MSKENTKKGILLDVYYKEDKLYCTIKNKGKKDYICDFLPYFYISFSKKPKSKDLDFIKNNLDLQSIQNTKKENKQNIYKIKFKTIEDLIKSRKNLRKNKLNLDIKYTLYEYDIPFMYRFYLDHNLSSFINVEYTLDSNKHIKSIKEISRVNLDKLKQGCFDIEVLMSNTLAFPKPGKDPIISISYIDNNSKQKTFFLAKNLESKEVKTKQKQLQNKMPNTDILLYTSEKKLIEDFRDLIIKEDPDILYTYNGKFDFKFIKKAYKSITNKDIDFGSRRLSINSRGSRTKVKVDGIIHFDVYLLMRLLNYFQVFNFPKLNLNSLYENLTSNKKLELKPKQMILAYNNKDFLKIIKYNLDDCKATLNLANQYIGFVYEMSYFLKTSILDILYSSASLMVEKLFIKDYFKDKKIIPNKPPGYRIKNRYKNRFSGAFVYQPSAGLYKDVAILDFRSYHISLLISYNISPETVDRKDLGFKFERYVGHKVYKKPKGFVPGLLKKLLDLRMKFKKQMKEEEKGTSKYNSLYSKQYAIKILLASSYGYMGFPVSRWYCKGCLDIMYHLVRKNIKKLISDLEDLGYNIVYGDTDSCFIEFNSLDKLKIDLNKINSSLPKGMFLELEDIFKSAVFVKARGKNKAAKKKYALLDYNNELKIKGFEYVRRDWCKLVKQTQKKILEILLKKQDSNKAISYLRKVIRKLQNKEVPKEKLVMRSFLGKSVKNYKSTTPALAAYKHAKEKGSKIKQNDLIEFIITDTSGKTISSRAKLAKYVKSNNYDVHYYINNQLLPAIYPILQVFNISKDELLTSTKQKDLNSFFK